MVQSTSESLEMKKTLAKTLGDPREQARVCIVHMSVSVCCMLRLCCEVLFVHAWVVRADVVAYTADKQCVS